ncbi:MAG: response regulator [Rhodocyclaceae bacterium]|nr:response regulator [Rhodocyclaceae bacterium]
MLLIVEDDAALAGYLHSVLSAQGHEVRVAHDAATAQPVIAGSTPPGIGVLDLGLPPSPSSIREGIALLEEWLRRVPGAKIIVLTGQDDETSAQEAIRCGAFDFLVKPVEMPAVLQAVARAALFNDHEGRMSAQGETRIQFTARLADGPREVAAAAEEQLVRKTLAETDHNVAQTARRLGLVRENVYYYLKKYGIRRPD